MPQYDNTNKGVLFNNDRKEKDTHPDFKGSVNFDGVECWLSGWWKKGKSGDFLSLSVEKKKETVERRNIPNRPASRDLDDEIPF